MFGHKKIYKVTNLKVHSKGRYLVKKNPFSRTTTNGSFGLQRCFPVFVISQFVVIYMQINYLPAGGAVGVGEISADQCRSDQIRSERVLGTVPYKLRARAAAQRDNVPHTRNKISWEAI